MDYEWLLTQIFRDIFNRTSREEFSSEEEYREELRNRLEKAYWCLRECLFYDEEKGKLLYALVGLHNSKDFNEDEKRGHRRCHYSHIGKVV